MSCFASRYVVVKDQKVRSGGGLVKLFLKKNSVDIPRASAHRRRLCAHANPGVFRIRYY